MKKKSYLLELARYVQDDWSIPIKQKRAVVKLILELEEQSVDRNSAIFTAYDTSAYSQREIGDYFHLHPSRVGVILIFVIRDPTPFFQTAIINETTRAL